MNNKGSDKNVANIEDIKVIQHIISFYKDLDVIHSNDKCKEIVALENILAELEQKDKRIKELEEELEKANRQLDLDYVEENFIPKQVIKDKIEKIIRETTPTPVFKPKSMWDDTDYERLYKTQPLLELLEGGSK